MQPLLGVVYKGKNLIVISLLTLSALSFVPQFLLESQLSFKLDELLVIILAIIGLLWYFNGGNCYGFSMVPAILVTAALVAKIAGIFIEIGDAGDVASDIGALILLLSAAVVAWYQYRKREVFTTPIKL